MNLVISAGGYNLSGLSCVLLAAPGNQTAPQTNAENALSLPLTVASGGLTALYSGTDFATAGAWTLWLKVLPLTGQPIFSAPVLVYVFPAPQT
ncbi:MAG: hypothetical protein ACREML_12510 [Vulcanimicrobiaceae bacterium]